MIVYYEMLVKEKIEQNRWGGQGEMGGRGERGRRKRDGRGGIGSTPVCLFLVAAGPRWRRGPVSHPWTRADHPHHSLLSPCYQLAGHPNSLLCSSSRLPWLSLAAWSPGQSVNPSCSLPRTSSFTLICVSPSLSLSLSLSLPLSDSQITLASKSWKPGENSALPPPAAATSRINFSSTVPPT